MGIISVLLCSGFLCYRGSWKPYINRFSGIEKVHRNSIKITVGFWCSECFNIRTQAWIFRLGEIDCFSAFFAIECECNPAIIKEAIIDKAVNQHAALVKLLGIKLYEPMKPKNNLFTGKRGLCQCLLKQCGVLVYPSASIIIYLIYNVYVRSW